MRARFANVTTTMNRSLSLTMNRPLSLIALLSRVASSPEHILFFVCNRFKFLRNIRVQFQKDRSNSVKTNSVPPISKALLERSNLALTLKQAGLEDHGNSYLTRIGSLAKTIRIQEGYSRNEFAKRLGITPDQLLFLETGFGIDEDITVEKLIYLCDDLTDTNQEEFRRLLGQYRSYLRNRLQMTKDDHESLVACK